MSIHRRFGPSRDFHPAITSVLQHQTVPCADKIRTCFHFPKHDDCIHMSKECKAVRTLANELPKFFPDMFVTSKYGFGLVNSKPVTSIQGGGYLDEVEAMSATKLNEIMLRMVNARNHNRLKGWEHPNLDDEKATIILEALLDLPKKYGVDPSNEHVLGQAIKGKIPRVKFASTLINIPENDERFDTPYRGVSLKRRQDQMSLLWYAAAANNPQIFKLLLEQPVRRGVEPDFDEWSLILDWLSRNDSVRWTRQRLDLSDRNLEMLNMLLSIPKEDIQNGKPYRGIDLSIFSESDEDNKINLTKLDVPFAQAVRQAIQNRRIEAISNAISLKLP